MDGACASAQAQEEAHSFKETWRRSQMCSTGERFQENDSHEMFFFYTGYTMVLSDQNFMLNMSYSL